MKNILSSLSVFMFLILMLCIVSCDSKKTEDSKEIAEDQNEEKFDDTKLEDDSEFAVATADGSMLEASLGELAQTNAASSAVKKLGQQMITDNKKTNEELKALALQKNITIPEVLSDRSQKKYDDLAKKTGEDFDDAYTDFMVKDHEEDIDAFKKEADKGSDSEIKLWAADHMPVLEQHLEMAKQTEKTVDQSN